MKDNNQSVTNELETGGKRRWRANCVTSLTARWHQPIGSDALLNTRWPCTKSKTFQLAASVVNVTLWSIEKSRREITPPPVLPTLAASPHPQQPPTYTSSIYLSTASLIQLVRCAHFNQTFMSLTWSQLLMVHLRMCSWKPSPPRASESHGGWVQLILCVTIDWMCAVFSCIHIDTDLSPNPVLFSPLCP